MIAAAQLLLLTASLAQQQDAVEWVHIPFDPPTSTPRTYWRSITVERGKPAIIQQQDPNAGWPSRFVGVEAVPIDGTEFWCVWPTSGPALMGLAIDQGDGIFYSFSVPFTAEVRLANRPDCGSAVSVSDMRIRVRRVLGMLLVTGR